MVSGLVIRYHQGYEKSSKTCKQVRLSLYILSLGGPIIAELVGSAEFKNAINASLGLNGLALFLAAVISSVNGTLALFHAICIFHMLALAGITINPKGSYPLGAVRIWSTLVAQLIVVIGSTSFFLYVFATAPAFGNQPQCNAQTIYVLFGYNISATNNVIRWIFVAGLSLILSGYGLFLLCFTGMGCLFALDCSGRCRNNQRITWAEGNDGGWQFPYYLIGHLFVSSYLIAMLELMIKRNNIGPGLGSWTFGQVLAMALLLGPLIELVSLLLGVVDEGPASQREIEIRRRR